MPLSGLPRFTHPARSRPTSSGQRRRSCYRPQGSRVAPSEGACGPASSEVDGKYARYSWRSSRARQARVRLLVRSQVRSSIVRRTSAVGTLAPFDPRRPSARASVPRQNLSEPTAKLQAEPYRWPHAAFGGLGLPMAQPHRQRPSWARFSALALTRLRSKDFCRFGIATVGRTARA